MPLACGLIGKPCQLVRRKLWMTYPSQGTPMHLVQRCFIDDIVRVSGAQRIEEVNPPAPRRRKQNLKPSLGSCPYYQYSGNPAYSPARTHIADLAQLAQFEGDFANFADSPASRINGLAAVCGRIGRVVATKAIPFCRGV